MPTPCTSPSWSTHSVLFLCFSHTYSSEEEAVHARTLRRSLMEYSFFDWAKVPRATERRLSAKPFDNPQVITTRFR